MESYTPDDLKKSLDDNQRIFLKLWKKGCGICKLSNSATDRMEKQNPHDLKFVKIDVGEYPEMMGLADSDVLPLFFVFTDQKKRGMYTGFKGLDKLEEFVSDSLKN
ncbi:MAG: thioredoxin family protein [Pseudobacteriovorax sp.]|nr:thioredoxin family protein [Pseudobacteriovorax sp.]